MITAWVRMVAVVVAVAERRHWSLVAEAVLANWAPHVFLRWSSSSMSRAIVTPSLVMVGPPNFLSSTTYRPRGPSMTLTASANLSTPRWQRGPGLPYRS